MSRAQCWSLKWGPARTTRRSGCQYSLPSQQVSPSSCSPSPSASWPGWRTTSDPIHTPADQPRSGATATRPGAQPTPQRPAGMAETGRTADPERTAGRQYTTASRPTSKRGSTHPDGTQHNEPCRGGTQRPRPPRETGGTQKRMRLRRRFIYTQAGAARQACRGQTEIAHNTQTAHSGAQMPLPPGETAQTIDNIALALPITDIIAPGR